VRVAFTGVGHWHLPLYLEPLAGIPGTEVVGVSDPDEAVARAVGDRTGAPAFTDWRALIAATAPEFVFVLGRHIDMPEVVLGLLDAGIPFAVEKPAGVDAPTVARMAGRAREVGGFAAVPFVFRHSGMLDLLRSLPGDERPLYLSFQFVAGSIERYRGGNEWMLDPALSGGGVMANLGVHFLDLSRLLLGPDLAVSSSELSNGLDGLAVEDHAAVVLRAPGATSVIQTGYIYPAPHKTFDLHFSIRTPRRHLAAWDETGFHVITDGGAPVFHPTPVSNVEYYPVFVRDVLRRVREGEPPLADLDDMAATAALLAAVYSLNSHLLDDSVAR
jgi:predicted dehydrogenase